MNSSCVVKSTKRGRKPLSTAWFLSCVPLPSAGQKQAFGEEAGSASLLCQVVNPSRGPHTTGSVAPPAAFLAGRAPFSVLRVPQGSRVYSLFFQG